MTCRGLIRQQRTFLLFLCNKGCIFIIIIIIIIMLFMHIFLNEEIHQINLACIQDIKTLWLFFCKLHLTKFNVIPIKI